MDIVNVFYNYGGGIMENRSTYDKVKALRSDGIDFATDISFKKAAFGGYDCKEVEEYIRTLKNNMQISERAYNDKFEEYASASAMYSQEREKLIRKIKEYEEEFEKLRNISLESIEKRKKATETIQNENTELKAKIATLQKQVEGSELTQKAAEEIEEIKKGTEAIQNENMELKAKIASLQQQVEESELAQKAAEEIEEIKKENKRLTEELCELIETKNKLESQAAVYTTELNKLAKYNEKLITENSELKKTETMLRTSKRNFAMGMNMRVFEYQQRHQLGIDSINNSICDISNALEGMKADLEDLFEKSKADLKEEEL
jgi:chromosome segregation ATPase